MTIANWISAVLVLAFVGLALATGLPFQTIVLGHLACGAVVLLLTFGLFAFGWIGGGDAKLAAATAVWVGWAHLSDYGLIASVIGAGLTFGILWFRKLVLPVALSSKAWIVRLHQKNAGVPYGIALACSGLLIYPETPFWRSLVGI